MQSQHQALALQIARQVRSGELSRHLGAQLLSSKTAIPATSAGIVIAVYLNMSVGQVFKRTLSASDMEYLISRIADEEGPAQLKQALAALRLHIEYRESDGVRPHQHKAILGKYEDWLRENTAIAVNPVYLGDLEAEFSRQVEVAGKLQLLQRQEQLAKAPKHPKKVARLVYVFERNPDVVVEVLRRARGYCEGCKGRAPFQRRSNGTAYLEVHHKQPLSEDGEDTVENAIALCPNCHRQSHFG